MTKLRFLIGNLVFCGLLTAALAAAPQMLETKVLQEGYPGKQHELLPFFEGCCDDAGPFPASASHALESQDGNHYYPGYLVDNNLDTCWAVQGGPGEWFEVGVGAANGIPFHGFDLVNGYLKSEKLWRMNSRIKTLRVVIDGKPYADVHLLDTYSVQGVRFPEPQPRLVDRVRFQVLEIYPGSDYDDLCVSEFQLEVGH